MRSGRGILPVAGTEDPVPFAVLILDLEIVPDRRELGVALPPFPEDAFRTRPPVSPSLTPEAMRSTPSWPQPVTTSPLLIRWLKAFLSLLIAAFLNRPKQLAA